MSERKTPGRDTGERDAPDRRQSGRSRPKRRPAVDRKALERTLRWALEENERQRQFIVAALEILDPPELH